MNWILAKWASVKAWTVRQYRKVVAFLLTLLVGVGVISYAALVDVSWDHPITRADGTPLPLEEIAETRWYCDGSFVEAIPGPADVGQLDLSFGDHTCHATTVDVFGLESVPSETITKTVRPGSPPNPPDVTPDPTP